MKAIPLFLILFLACSNASKEKPTGNIVGDVYPELDEEQFVSLVSSFVITSYGLNDSVHVNSASVDMEIREYMDVHKLDNDAFARLRKKIEKSICDNWPEKIAKEKTAEWGCGEKMKGELGGLP